MTNWPAYGRALRRRGEITVWFSPAILLTRTPLPTGRRGGHTGRDPHITVLATRRITRRTRDLARKVEGQLHDTRSTFAAFDEPLTPRGDDPIPASQASDRLFEVICEEFALDPDAVEPESDWQAAIPEETASAEDDGLILL